MSNNDLSDAFKQVINSPRTIAQNITPRQMYPWAPTAGYVVGNAVAPGIGGVVGAGLGQIAARGAGLAYGDVNPSNAQSPSKEAIMPMAQTLLGNVNLPGPLSTAVGEGLAEAGETMGTNYYQNGLPKFITRITTKQGSVDRSQ